MLSCPVTQACRAGVLLTWPLLWIDLFSPSLLKVASCKTEYLNKARRPCLTVRHQNRHVWPDSGFVLRIVPPSVSHQGRAEARHQLARDLDGIVTDVRTNEHSALFDARFP